MTVETVDEAGQHYWDHVGGQDHVGGHGAELVDGCAICELIAAERGPRAQPRGAGMTYRERGFVVLAGGASGLEVLSEVFKTEAEAVAAVERLGGHWSRQYMIVPALGLATNQKNA